MAAAAPWKGNAFSAILSQIMQPPGPFLRQTMLQGHGHTLHIFLEPLMHFLPRYLYFTGGKGIVVGRHFYIVVVMDE